MKTLILIVLAISTGCASKPEVQELVVEKKREQLNLDAYWTDVMAQTEKINRSIDHKKKVGDYYRWKIDVPVSQYKDVFQYYLVTEKKLIQYDESSKGYYMLHFDNGMSLRKSNGGVWFVHGNYTHLDLDSNGSFDCRVRAKPHLTQILYKDQWIEVNNKKSSFLTGVSGNGVNYMFTNGEWEKQNRE
ncbi:MAG: hypothetical protein NE327_11090 [Lentisphaeraceae bacterium]|nr:hypothetical protein [Lentisphaeraceae bacterium]